MIDVAAPANGDIGHDEPPIELDRHRGMAAQQATELRRRLVEVEADQAALRQRQAELEKFMLATPPKTWEETADTARYLLRLLAATTVGRDPRRQKLIAMVTESFERLSAPASPG